MKCVILAAGYATRLYPLTENFPKPLLPLGGKAILDWLVDDLAASGRVEAFVVVTNHRYAPHFTRWAAGKNCPVTVLDDGTAANETRLGALGDLLFALDALALDEPLLVAAGDNVLDFSLTRLLDYAGEKGASCVMRCRETTPERLRRCGVAQIGEDDRILAMEEKPAHPRSQWVIPPFYCYTREAVGLLRQALAEGCSPDAPGSYAAWLCARLPLYAMEMPGRRHDIGDPDSYRQAQALGRPLTDEIGENAHGTH